MFLAQNKQQIVSQMPQSLTTTESACLPLVCAAFSHCATLGQPRPRQSGCAQAPGVKPLPLPSGLCVLIQ